MSAFEWFAVCCGLAGVAGIAAIAFGGWKPPSRLVFYALLAAFGLGLGTAVGRLAAFSIPLVAGLVVLYLVVRWIVRRRAQPR